MAEQKLSAFAKAVASINTHDSEIIGAILSKIGIPECEVSKFYAGLVKKDVTGIIMPSWSAPKIAWMSVIAIFLEDSFHHARGWKSPLVEEKGGITKLAHALEVITPSIREMICAETHCDEDHGGEFARFYEQFLTHTFGAHLLQYCDTVEMRNIAKSFLVLREAFAEHSKVVYDIRSPAPSVIAAQQQRAQRLAPQCPALHPAQDPAPHFFAPQATRAFAPAGAMTQHPQPRAFVPRSAFAPAGAMAQHPQPRIFGSKHGRGILVPVHPHAPAPAPVPASAPAPVVAQVVVDTDS